MPDDRKAGRPRVLGEESERLTIYLSKDQADYMRAQADGSHVTISASFRELVDAAMSGEGIDLAGLAEDGR